MEKTDDEIMEESRYYPVLKESDDEMAKVCVRAMLNEARADQFRKDTDERVQSIKDAKQEQLAEDIKKFRKLILEEADIGHPDTYEDGRNHYDCLECAQTDMAKRLLETLHALQQSKAKSD
jgi:phosphoserine phosphatase